MQTAIHPHAPKAIKNQNKVDLEAGNLLNYLLHLLLTHRSDPTLCHGAGRIFLWQLTRLQQHDSP